jgi:hypothetical protein
VPAMAAEVLMFLVHLTTTAFMTAIIWFMQIGTPHPYLFFRNFLSITNNSE